MIHAVLLVYHFLYDSSGFVEFHFINLLSLAVSLRTTRFNIKKFYMLLPLR